jgi:thiol-disulfide isomerase/thioredoxin
MKLNVLLLLLMLLSAFSGKTQQPEAVSLNIGDAAPAMNVRKWIKGSPVTQFEKGKIYVVEFWATWCKPCIAGMPHLSELAQKYKNRVIVIGISILERKGITDEKLSSFVDSMSGKMAYTVGAEEGDLMAANWLKASGERGIPQAYVVDGQGRIAWIGLPKHLDKVLPQITSGSWNTEEAGTRRREHQRLTARDNEVITRLNPFMGNPGNPTGALAEIEKILAEHPRLKYYPLVGHYTFYALLKTDPVKALEFGEAWLATSEEPKWKTITDAVTYSVEKLKKDLPKGLYELGASSFRAQLEHYPWSMYASETYSWIARLEYLAGNKSKAIEAQRKAIEAARNKVGVSSDKLLELETALQKYKGT